MPILHRRKLFWQPKSVRDPVAGSTTVNLVLKSQAFDNAAWSKGAHAGVTADFDVAPDTTTTADRIIPSGAATDTDVYVYQQGSSGTTGTFTASIYAKPSGTWTWIRLIMDGDVVGAATVWFNITGGGAVGTTAGTGYISSAITGPDAQGYFRCKVTGTSVDHPYLTVTLADADNSSSATHSGTNGVLFWGAQLETGSSATTYTPNL